MAHIRPRGAGARVRRGHAGGQGCAVGRFPSLGAERGQAAAAAGVGRAGGAGGDRQKQRRHDGWLRERRRAHSARLARGPGLAAAQGGGKAACGVCCMRLGWIGPAVAFLAGRRAGLCGLSRPAGEEGVVG